MEGQQVEPALTTEVPKLAITHQAPEASPPPLALEYGGPGTLGQRVLLPTTTGNVNPMPKVPIRVNCDQKSGNKEPWDAGQPRVQDDPGFDCRNQVKSRVPELKGLLHISGCQDLIHPGTVHRLHARPDNSSSPWLSALNPNL